MSVEQTLKIVRRRRGARRRSGKLKIEFALFRAARRVTAERAEARSGEWRRRIDSDDCIALRYLEKLAAVVRDDHADTILNMEE